MARQSNILTYVAIGLALYQLFFKNKPAAVPAGPGTVPANGILPPATTNSSMGRAGDTWTDLTNDGKFKRTYTRLRDGNINVLVEDLYTGQTSTYLILIS